MKTETEMKQLEAVELDTVQGGIRRGGIVTPLKSPTRPDSPRTGRGRGGNRGKPPAGARFLGRMEAGWSRAGYAASTCRLTA